MSNEHENNAPTDATGRPLSIESKRAIRGAPARHAAAYRERAGLIGILASCVCCFPLDVDPNTTTGHDELCPSEAIAKSMAATAERRAREGW